MLVLRPARKQRPVSEVTPVTIDVHLKGGSVVRLSRIKDFTVKVNGGDCTGWSLEMLPVRWWNRKRKPMHIDPREIAAVVRVR